MSSPWRDVLSLFEENKRLVETIVRVGDWHRDPQTTLYTQQVAAHAQQMVARQRDGRCQVPVLQCRHQFPVLACKNYHEHATEFDKSGFNATSGASAIPAFPQLFTKATGTLAGPTDAIRFDPKHTSSVDYEGEIGVVIGQRCRNVSKADALGKVFGFVALNDVTARDLQKNHAQWFLGKSLDGFCPLGPWIATQDDAPLDSLRLQTWVNGELRQDAHISQLIFDVATLIETLSAAMTLLPGDIIATGTPVGVGIGFSPPRFLRHGDQVRVAVTGLGELNNRVEAI
jgi:2-keto-4-pentenoate hydratase/2-oxohepta-3-ene-1,7-dioic acid hydratase in catechol pathway